MKLDEPVTFRPNKTRDSDGKIISPDPITLSSLEVIYVDNPKDRSYYITINHVPSQIYLWLREDYDLAGDITKSMARTRLYELAENMGGLSNFLQNFFPRTLEDDPYGPGTILHSMFNMLGIKAGPNCSCKRHALEMNSKGIEWCEENIDTILGWLKIESEKRRIPWVEAVGRLAVNRAINKSKKYRDQQTNET